MLGNERAETDLPDVLDNWLESRLLSVHTILVGKVQNFDKKLGKCDVDIQTNLPIPGGEFVDAPFIASVPIFMPGSPDYMTEIDIPDGTGCMVLCGEVGIGNYLAGGEKANADGSSRFKLTDAIAIPGLFPYERRPASPKNKVDQSGDNVTATTAGTHAVDAKAVELNGNAKSFVTHAELDTALQLMLVSINANFGTKLDGGGTPGVNSLDISASATQTIKTGG